MRLFVAVPPPAEQLRALDAALGVRDESLRWVPPEQWHLTLVFCGEVSPTVVPELTERLARGAARTPRFELNLAAAGSFPRQAARARVLWVGLGGELETLTRLAERCSAAARRSGIGVEDRPFRPHLTVARCGRPTEVTAWVRLLDGYRGPTWQADRLTLVASHLGEGPRRRPRYEDVGSFPLGRD